MINSDKENKISCKTRKFLVAPSFAIEAKIIMFPSLNLNTYLRCLTARLFLSYCNFADPFTLSQQCFGSIFYRYKKLTKFYCLILCDKIKVFFFCWPCPAIFKIMSSCSKRSGPLEREALDLKLVLA